MIDKEKKPRRVEHKSGMIPTDTVYVGKPTKWGNPFSIHRPFPFAVDATGIVRLVRCDTLEMCVAMYKKRLLRQIGLGDITQHDLDELKGKNLACDCSLDEPCHADVLLEIVNKEKIHGSE